MINKTMKITLFAMALLLSMMAQAKNFAVVINSTNNLGWTSVDKDSEVFQIYLKKRSEWSTGIKAKPLKLADDHPAQQAFVREFLKMDLSQHDKYWQGVRKTGKTKPAKVRNIKTGLRMVQKDRGAFLVVPVDETHDLPKGLGVLIYF